MKLIILLLALFLSTSFLAQTDDFSKKEKEYLEVIETSSKDCDANFNLGALYHNRAVDLILAMDKKEATVEALLKVQGEYEAWISKSKKYLMVAEKCKTKK